VGTKKVVKNTKPEHVENTWAGAKKTVGIVSVIWSLPPDF
jgi:hypothetical protein